MSNVAIDLTKTVKEIITTMKTAIDNLNTDVDSLKSEILLAAHPVGSYYISDNATNPGTLFGGTWKMLDPGLTLISQGKGTDKFGSFEFVAGQTYGERLHQLTVEELSNHSHGVSISTTSLVGDTYTWRPAEYEDVKASGVLSCSKYGEHCSGDGGKQGNGHIHLDVSHAHSASISATGGNARHENRPPYVVVNRWKRTA